MQMNLKKIADYDEFQRFFCEFQAWSEECDGWVQSQLFYQEKPDQFSFHGYSYSAGRDVDFLVERSCEYPEYFVSWRESVLCPISRLNSRSRAAVHIFEQLFQPKQNERIWVCEQVTPLYRYLASKFPLVTGSEYLGPEFTPGYMRCDSIRHESMTSSSFDNESLDYVLSFDVLEHIPNYRSAFTEILRILKPGGKLIWTAPFVAGAKKNRLLAEIQNGQVIHHASPSYHGDPLTNKPILCYTFFGWEVIEEMRALGFSSAYGICYSSIEFGYLGAPNFLLVGVK